MKSACGEMVQEYLAKRGFKVSTAASAEELRTVVAAGGIDLIVLDINMPGEDGLSALRALRAGNDVPVIMLTAAGEVIGPHRRPRNGRRRLSRQTGRPARTRGAHQGCAQAQGRCGR